MVFAQFFQLSTGYVAGTIPPEFREDAKTLIEACGDRGVIVLDGRLAQGTLHDIAWAECKARGFKAYELRRGDSFNRSSADSGLITVKY